MSFNLASGLEGKGVIVTGAAGGIGREVVLGFAAAGCRVCAVDLKQDAVDAVIRECEGGPHRAVGFDLRKTRELPKVVADTEAAFGRFDVLVNNAGVQRVALEVPYAVMRGFRSAEVEGEDRRSLVAEAKCHRLADAARGAGDRRDLACKLSGHARLRFNTSASRR
jgi:NAD(P)-dependent dehydrogenase (short-subunit alcohol dehydrogenase family)